MAHSMPSVGTLTVNQSGTSAITAGVMHVASVSVSQSPDGTMKLQVSGEGQGASNNATPIPPNNEYALHAGGVIDAEDVEMLCEKLGRNYVDLAVRLEFSQPELEMLEMDFSKNGYRHVARRMLNDWKNRLSTTATRAVLSEKLRLIGRNDIVVDLLRPRV